MLSKDRARLHKGWLIAHKLCQQQQHQQQAINHNKIGRLGPIVIKAYMTLYSRA